MVVDKVENKIVDKVEYKILINKVVINKKLMFKISNKLIVILNI